MEKMGLKYLLIFYKEYFIDGLNYYSSKKILMDWRKFGSIFLFIIIIIDYNIQNSIGLILRFSRRFWLHEDNLIIDPILN